MFTRKRQQTTYASRKRHRSSSNPVPASSPVKSASLLENDTTVPEMVRRMKKRTRDISRKSSAATCSDGNVPDDLDDDVARPSKKFKGMPSSSRTPLSEKQIDTNALPLSSQNIPETNMEELEQDEEPLKTPAARSRPLEVEPPKRARDSESLSPLPVSSRSCRILKTRASAKYLKENVPQDPSPRTLLTATSLASPFHSQHATPVTSPKPMEGGATAATATSNAQKNSRSKIISSRTRSAASRRPTNRSGPNSPSVQTSIHRRTSESNLQARNKQQWLVPAQVDGIAKKTSAYKPSRLNQSFSREGSFFDGVPQACSTPLHSARATYDTDMTPRLLAQHPINDATPLVRNFTMLTDDTPRVSMLGRTSAFRARSNDSIFDGVDSVDDEGHSVIARTSNHAPRKGTRRATVHIPEDSIFSTAMDITIADGGDSFGYASRSSDAKPGGTLMQPIAAPPSSPTRRRPSATSEDGDELPGMFSILELDENGQMAAELPEAGNAVPQGSKKPKRLGNRQPASKQLFPGGKAKKQASIRQKPTPYPSVSQDNIRNVPVQLSPIRGDAISAATATPPAALKMRVLEEPLDTSVSDDELLLTSKGWNYGLD